MNQQGFSLLEVLTSVGILTLLVGLSLPVFETFVRRNDLDLTTQSIASSIRRANTYARSMNGDTTWGVSFASASATLFKGASYATRDTNYDETIALPGSISLSGTSEVVFTKLTGAPSTAVSVTLTSTINDTRTITVNTEGMVNY